MTRYLWLLALPLMVVVIEAYTLPNLLTKKCHERCRCDPIDTGAICDTLDIKKFTTDIRILKIVNPIKNLKLEKDIFSNLNARKLNSIYIENATIENIDEHAFRNLNNLRDLIIVNSKIPNIDSNTFINAERLYSIKFDNCKIGKFDYVKSASVKELIISNCKLTHISNNNFDNLIELTYLNLENNLIEDIDSRTFSNLKELTEVILSNNNIKKLPSNLFENNTELSHLNLNDNPLEKLSINVLSNLEKLDLKSCKLTEIGDTLRNLDLLTILDLSYNKLTKLDSSAFGSLYELKFVDLSNNNFIKLPDDVFKNNSKLQKIILNNNNLKTIPKFFSTQGPFETYQFSCKNCNVTSLPADTFEHMPALITLMLSKNHLKTINTAVFQHLHNLKILDLSYNQITTIDTNSFIKNSGLEHLNLANNPLTALSPEVFSVNKVLKKLNISGCGLTELWSEPKKNTLDSLEEVYASNNNISSLPSSDVKITSNLIIFDIENNPLECTPELRNTIRWLTMNDVKPATSADLVKSHESLKSSANTFELEKDRLYSWENLANQTCPSDYEDYYEEDYYDEQTEEDNDDDDTDEIKDEYNSNELGDKILTIPIEKENINILKDDEIDLEDEDIKTDFSEYPVHRYIQYSYLWPAFIFIFTALAVLVIAANVILLILKKRGTLDLPRSNLPQIKIIPWNTTTKMKKHSGSVYQPLSEDRSGPKTPMINRYEVINTVEKPA